MSDFKKNVALRLCVTATFSALLVAGKQALAILPNVEIVTLLIALCAFVWGLGYALPAVFVFIAVDVAIYGINTWVISYIIHWNAVALCFWLLAKVKPKSKVLTVFSAAVLAVFLTACFGALTSAVDTVIGFTGKGFFTDFSEFAKRFSVMYVAGISFYVTQVVCNAILFSVAFLPLWEVNAKAKMRMFV